MKEARSAKWFSVMADECTDESTIEQMSICIRYVKASDGKFDAREEFIGFVELELNAFLLILLVFLMILI